MNNELIIETVLANEWPVWRPIPSRQLARLLEVSVQDLANWRVRETGPPPLGLRRGKGNKIYYRLDEVLSWLSDGEIQPWVYVAEWLRRRGFEVENECEEAVTWLTDKLEPMFPRQKLPI